MSEKKVLSLLDCIDTETEYYHRQVRKIVNEIRKELSEISAPSQPTISSKGPELSPPRKPKAVSKKNGRGGGADSLGSTLRESSRQVSANLSAGEVSGSVSGGNGSIGVGVAQNVIMNPNINQ